ncbi:hypothetical protein MFIFM68171_06538 [Madurella fahalii]|uniref:FAD-binding PCMH-type domain-containing protein n=1 Tax=Madurella fahalii TaxID=1157608 RepID=A0ABQ0GF17_9PEZI
MARLVVLAAHMLRAVVWVLAESHNSTKLVLPASGSAPTACSLLYNKYPDRTLFGGSTGYTFETRTQYWSARAYQDPACVFVPQNAEQVSHAVKTLTRTRTRFAVRGGGHMPVVGANSIGNDGVLLSMSGLDSLGLSKTRTVVSVGAGNRWRDVYSFLKPHSLAAVGGRVGGVGVGGLILGGGISFHSSQYGFAADNVVRLEAVLASGAVIEATADNDHADLFWALKGGGNSFAIVTRFDLRTVPSPRVWVGISQYSDVDSTAYLDAVYNFGRHGAADAKAAIIPTILTFPSTGRTAYAAARFYDSETPPAVAFENFTAPVMAPVNDTYALQSLAAHVLAADILQPIGVRQEFRVLSILVDRDAVSYVHDTFIAATGSLAGIAGLTASITFQPVTASFLRRGLCYGGPRPQGVLAASAPYLWIVQNLSWLSSQDDAAAVAFIDHITAELEEGLVSKGVAGKYLYLNDAGSGQPVFQRYPPRNLKRLKAIRSRYDPRRVYTNLLTGGWKVLNA